MLFVNREYKYIEGEEHRRGGADEYTVIPESG